MKHRQEGGLLESLNKNSAILNINKDSRVRNCGEAKE